MIKSLEKGRISIAVSFYWYSFLLNGKMFDKVVGELKPEEKWVLNSKSKDQDEWTDRK